MSAQGVRDGFLARALLVCALVPCAAHADPPERFLPSPDVSHEEQAFLEQLQAVRADPRGQIFALRGALDREVQADPWACRDPLRLIAPLRRAEARPPLAPSQTLMDAARAHARDMIDRGYFEHVNPDGLGPNQRIRDRGYALPVDQILIQNGSKGYGYRGEHDANQVEAIHEATSHSILRPLQPALDTWEHAALSLIVDRCVPSRGHRRHLLGQAPISAMHREIGIGGAWRPDVQPGPPTLRGYVFRVAVESAHRLGADPAVVGVVWRDANGDNAFTAGEGVEGIVVHAPELPHWTRTAPGGGYVLPVPRGWSGQVHIGADIHPVTIDRHNQKLDVRLPDRSPSQ